MKRTYLLLGFPLLQALSPAEVAAVIAHELGHLCGAEGRFAASILRGQARCTRLADDPGPATRGPSHLIRRALHRYALLFQAYSFIQARRQEYEADQFSVRAIGAAATGSALLRVSLTGEFVTDVFWPQIFRRADREPTPTLAPYALLMTALKSRSRGLAQHARLARCLNQSPGYRDTHPALADRLRAIGVPPYVPAPITVSSAEILLGERCAPLQRELDQAWRERVAEWWTGRYRYASDSRLRLMALERRAIAQNPEVSERARLISELGLVTMAGFAPVPDPNALPLGPMRKS